MKVYRIRTQKSHGIDSVFCYVINSSIHKLVNSMESVSTVILQRFKEAMTAIAKLYHPKTIREKGWYWAIGLFFVTYSFIVLILMMIWSIEPEPFDVTTITNSVTQQDHQVTGSTTTATVIHTIDVLLDKSGGYLSNDLTPPGLFMDNIPNWEYGALLQIRDITRAMRNDIARSQSQSLENPSLAKAEPLINFSHDSWIFPTTESQYRDSRKFLYTYLSALQADNQPSAQFYARADNLNNWLSIVSKRLGSLSQRLSASVGQERINTDLAGDPDAQQSTVTASEFSIQTPWLEIDNIFYEARGSSWAILHFLKAVEIDFEPVLKKKNALVSLKQIIRELESTQQDTFSPFVLNGGGFGLVTNYSLVMASYISRANAAVIDLRNLLNDG